MMPAKETSRAKGRPRQERNSVKRGLSGTQGRSPLPANLIRVHEAARRSRQTRFTALLHHVDIEALERAYRRLRRSAAPGVDGMTVQSHAEDLEARLRSLCDRIHSGRYRPLPVRRTYIPKADGGRRPLVCPLSRTRSFRAQSLRCLARSTRLTSSFARSGFDPDAMLIRRCVPYTTP